MSEASKLILQAIRDVVPDPQSSTALATVVGITATGATVTFDGEAATSTRVYRTLGPSIVGSRVLMLRVGTTWVVAGMIDGDSAAGAQVITFGASTNNATATFAHGLSWTPRSVTATSNDMQFVVACTAITSTQITLRAYYTAGTAPTGFGLTAYWHADR